MVNCRAGGSCEGGNPGGVYEFAYKHGIPDSSCEQYVAEDLLKARCSAVDICKDCNSQGCYAVDYKKYYISHFYSFRGKDKMKAEIYKYGPISCGMHVTDKFEDTYTGGIYSEHVLLPIPNHVISLIGWGKDAESGEEYWIGRNSWGTYWGEGGFFRIAMDKDNLAINSECTAGIPTFTPNNDSVEFI